MYSSIYQKNYKNEQPLRYYSDTMPTPIKKIIAIGGRKIRTADTLTIDKEIIRLSQKKHPKLLFIGTAMSDSDLYWQYIDKYFGKKLGCKTDNLKLIKGKPSAEGIKEKILSADIIYVGGGNTLKMMKVWRRLGVDKLLKTAWQQGTVLCGISAGSICWFESGHSDSMSFYNSKKWKYIKVRGIGFLKGMNCPHYNSETLGVPRKEHFRNMIEKTGGMGIAIDDNCAIEFIDDTYRVITSNKHAKAYRVFRQNRKVVSSQVQESKEFRPVKELFQY